MTVAVPLGLFKITLFDDAKKIAMKHSWSLYLVLILLLFTTKCIFSCTYSMSEEEQKINPYETGDTLVFVSNFGEFDTIRVVKVDRYYGKKNQNNIAPLVSNEEYIGVSVNHTTRDSENSRVKKAVHYFLILHKINRDSLLIYFNLEAKGAYSYYMNPFSLKRLKLAKLMQMELNNVEYNDVICLTHDRESLELEAYQNEPDFIKSIYWSKSIGYVKFDLGGGKAWVLYKKF